MVLKARAPQPRRETRMQFDLDDAQRMIVDTTRAFVEAAGGDTAGSLLIDSVEALRDAQPGGVGFDRDVDGNGYAGGVTMFVMPRIRPPATLCAV